MGKKMSKEVREWAILLSVLGGLYWTGWYKDVASFLQRGLLESGLISASPSDTIRPASYDFKLIDVDGKDIPFDSFRDKTVFINFWATWCPPCIAEMADIHDLYEKVGDDVSFAMISLDDDPETAKAFIEEKQFDFPIYFLSGSLPATYETQTIPTTYIISPDGNIVLEEKGLAKYDTKKLRNFLKDLGKFESSS